MNNFLYSVESDTKQALFTRLKITLLLTKAKMLLHSEVDCILIADTGGVGTGRKMAHDTAPLNFIMKCLFTAEKVHFL